MSGGAAESGAWPLLIGATGGSGTRAARLILMGAGVFMGERVNDSGDSEAFIPLYEQWINPVLAESRGLDYRLDGLPRAVSEAVRGAFAASDADYRVEAGTRLSGPWGVKNPRCLYLLPFWREAHPTLRLIHLVRDGRDMALSNNRNQVTKHYATLFGPPPADLPIEVASARLWARVNADAADWGERELGPQRYLRVRMEDLHADPVGTTARMLAWAGLAAAQAPQLAGLVTENPGLGRWRGADPDLVDAVTAACGATLARCGYA